MRFFERTRTTDIYPVVYSGFALLILVGAISPDAYAEEPPAAASLNSQHEEVAQEPKAENDDQATQPTDSSVSETFKDQITVTATKREATTQEIPLSIEVLTGERLKKMVVENPY